MFVRSSNLFAYTYWKRLKVCICVLQQLLIFFYLIDFHLYLDLFWLCSRKFDEAWIILRCSTHFVFLIFSLAVMISMVTCSQVDRCSAKVFHKRPHRVGGTKGHTTTVKSKTTTMPVLTTTLHTTTTKAAELPATTTHTTAKAKTTETSTKAKSTKSKSKK